MNENQAIFLLATVMGISIVLLVYAASKFTRSGRAYIRHREERRLFWAMWDQKERDRKIMQDAQQLQASPFRRGGR